MRMPRSRVEAMTAFEFRRTCYGSFPYSCISNQRDNERSFINVKLQDLYNLTHTEEIKIRQGETEPRPDMLENWTTGVVLEKVYRMGYHEWTSVIVRDEGKSRTGS